VELKPWAIRQVGTMNLFVVFRQEDGTLELVTPPLDGMILPGVTRDSVLALARSHAAGTLRIPNLTTKLAVSERGVTMKEVSEAVQSGRLVEMFGAGKCFFSLSLSLLQHFVTEAHPGPSLDSI